MSSTPKAAADSAAPPAKAAPPKEEHKEKEKEKSEDAATMWAHVFVDPLAGLHTHQNGIATADVEGKGMYSLVILTTEYGDYKLKVFSRGYITSEHVLLDLPSGIVSFFMADNTDSAAVGISSGPSLYIFKQLHPYYKFTLPPITASTENGGLSADEREAWANIRIAATYGSQPTPAEPTAQGAEAKDKDKPAQAPAETCDPDALAEVLNGIRAQGSRLSSRSLAFLATPPEERRGFIAMVQEEPLQEQANIVLVSKINLSQSDSRAVSCPIVCAENGDIFVLSPSNFAILARFSLPSPASCIHTSGTFEVDYRIIVACRNGCVYTLKGGVVSDEIIQLSALAIGVCRVNKHVVVAAMDRTFTCYTSRGKKVWSILMPKDITAMCPITYKPKSFKGIAIALAGGEVRVYQEKTLASTIEVEGQVVSMLFGPQAKEPGVLCMVLAGGAIVLKRIRRSFAFDIREQVPGPPPEQAIRINVPTKTQLYIDNTLRERENAVEMHRTFQRDLYMLRLKTTREYAKTLTTSIAPLVTTAKYSLKLDAEVRGIGPVFKLVVFVQNLGAEGLAGMTVSFMWKDTMYNVQTPCMQAPFLAPRTPYTFSTFVTCLTEEPVSSPIRVFVSKPPSPQPVLTAIVTMPVAEPLTTVR